MRCPNVKRLVTLFGLTLERARLIRKIARAHSEGGSAMQALVEEYCPRTDAHARACYGDPYGSANWRATMALEAIDECIPTTDGVEPLGPVDMHAGPPYQYLNVGDPYKPTLIYHTDNLFIGCWGDIAERHPDW